MTRTVTNQAQFELAAGVTLVSQLIEGTYHNGSPYSYTSHDLEGLSDNELDNLAKLAIVLQNLPEDGALDFDGGDLEEFIKEWAADTAESAELPFTFTDSAGTAQIYTPASLWEASGSCSEWEQSAQYGYDFGWNV
jgi:hypothetical protein